jgi:hypothetical protein
LLKEYLYLFGLRQEDQIYSITFIEHRLYNGSSTIILEETRQRKQADDENILYSEINRNRTERVFFFFCRPNVEKNY